MSSARLLCMACHGYITPTNKEVKTLLSGNRNAEHGKRGGTTAKRYPSLRTQKLFSNFSIETLRRLYQAPVILKVIAPILISFYHHPLTL